MRELSASLGRALGIGYEIFDGFVTAVNDNHTCDVKVFDSEDSILDGISLRSVADGEDSGILVVPAVDSHVVFARIEGQDDYTVLKTSKIDKLIVNAPEVILNDGTNKGIIIIDKLSAEIAKLNSAIATLKTATQTGLAAIDGIVPGTSAAFATATATIQQADLSQVTNEKVKH